MLWSQIGLLVFLGAILLISAQSSGKGKSSGSDTPFVDGLIVVGILFTLIFFAGGFSRIFHH